MKIFIVLFLGGVGAKMHFEHRYGCSDSDSDSPVEVNHE